MDETSIDPIEKGDRFHVGRVGEHYILDVDGNFGKVLLGVNETTGQLVAVKEIKQKQRGKDLKEEIRKEIEIMSEIPHHHNVVELHGNFNYEKTFYLIMDLCDMGHLKKYYLNYRLGLKTSVEIIIQIAEAVRFLHSLKIMHRDLKPENVMMTWDRNRPFPQLIDFGLATKTPLSDREMETSRMHGPNDYTAPEISSESSYNEKVDVFSIGLIFRWMINFPPSAVEPGVQDPIVTKVEKVVSDMTLVNPSKRISAEEAKTRLQKIFDEPEVSGALEAPPPKPHRNLPPAVAEIMSLVPRDASSSS